MSGEPLILSPAALTVAEVVSVARTGRSVKVGDDARRSVIAARTAVDSVAASDRAVYGLNTGFGSLSRVRIGADGTDLSDLQHNLIRSHAAGVGELLPREVVRAMLLLLAASLARGRSGVRIELIEQVIAVLNADIAPCIPSRGSVGASGDLSPLAHLALVLMGEGEAIVDGEKLSGADALAVRGLARFTLMAKEGLAVINGTHMMAAIGALALHDMRRLTSVAITSAAMSLDACRASATPLDARIHDARGQLGQQKVAQTLREALLGSTILESHADPMHDPRVQDPYCLRATPQVLGAALDMIEAAGIVIERELGAVTDNPLVFCDDDADAAFLTGANFHGMPLAIAFDAIKVALCHIAGIAERRVYWLLKATDSENPVNVYLSPQPGLHSGLMIVQYTAAACCNELQTLATPASVANIPTSAGIEDYNSMGATAAHQLRAAVELAREVIAIESLVMAEAIEYHRPLTSGDRVERWHARIRAVVPRLVADRSPSPDIAAIVGLITEG